MKMEEVKSVNFLKQRDQGHMMPDQKPLKLNL